jgi:hypothetical protein
MLRGAVPVDVGETVVRDGFAYADLMIDRDNRRQATA